MKRILLILAAALLAGIVCGCDEEKTLPYIPVDRPDDTPPASEDPESYTVTYQLVKVLQCSPNNPQGRDLFDKLDFFPSTSTSMTLSVSPLKCTVSFDNGDLPFYPFAERLPQGPVECVMDRNVVPYVIRIEGKESETIFASYEADGFTISFHLDSELVTYKYKFKSI